ncbi:hypothetical protein ACA758_01940 [Mycoplasmopsis agassizii]|uniref:hypothetical protein n=1 Tax=Mycoplasmopsis agassizii TaxID=33922 RepID=UPI0035281884
MKRRKLLTIMSLPIASFAVVAAIACTQQPTKPTTNAETIIENLPAEVKANAENNDLNKLKEKLQSLEKDVQTSFLNLLDQPNKKAFEDALKDGYKISKITLSIADKTNSSLTIFLSVSKAEDVKNKTIKIVDLKQASSQIPPETKVPDQPEKGKPTPPETGNPEKSNPPKTGDSRDVNPNPPTDGKPPANGNPPSTGKPPANGNPPSTGKPPDTQNPPSTVEPPANENPPDNQNPSEPTPPDNPPTVNPNPPVTVDPPKTEPEKPVTPPNNTPVQPPKTSEPYVQKFETDLKKFQGYEIKTELNSGLPTANDYLFDSSTTVASQRKSNVWTTQNGSIKGKNNWRDFQRPIPELDSPEWNPNKNTFNSAKEQRDEILANNFKLNPNQSFSQTYNFWYNQKIISNRNYLSIAGSGTNLDNVAEAPQPLKPEQAVKDRAVEMEQSDLKFNLNSLKHLVNNNEMGQNPKMFGWKLITLSDEIRLNKKSILSDHIFENDLKDQDKNLKLFQEVANDISNIKFYADAISNKTGTMTLYVTYKKGTEDKAFKIDLDKTNVDLKNDYDYIKFLNDRSVSLTWSYAGWFSENDKYDDDINDTWKGVKSRLDRNIKNFKTLPERDKPHNLNKYFGTDVQGLNFSTSNRRSNPTGVFASGGTAWVVDKIVDDSLPEGQHAFVMATNKHVLDIGKLAGTEIWYGYPGYQFSSNASNPKAINKQNSWLKNSGFYSFTWTRYETSDYSKTSHIPSTDLIPKNGGQPESEKWNYAYKEQLVSGNSKNSNNVVNFTSPMFKDGDARTILNATDDEPTWLTETRKNFINSIIYMPQYTIGHIAKNSGAQVDKNIGGGIKREEQNSDYTYQIMGPDLVLVKMVFKDSDLQKNWPALYEILQKPEDEQKSWFKALDLNPRTDDRTNSYMAGYPAANIKDGTKRIFSWRAADKSATSSMRDSFVTLGTSSSVQKFFRDWDADTYEKYYAPFDVNGRYNPDKSVDFPNSTYISNEKNGLYTSTVLSATESLYSGDHANPGNSGSMVVDANFNNYGILYAFIPNLPGGSRTSVHHLIQHDPYARSNVLENQRPNIRLELIEILKKKVLKLLI